MRRGTAHRYPVISACPVEDLVCVSREIAPEPQGTSFRRYNSVGTANIGFHHTGKFYGSMPKNLPNSPIQRAFQIPIHTCRDDLCVRTENIAQNSGLEFFTKDVNVIGAKK